MRANQISQALLLMFIVGLCSAATGQNCPGLSLSKKNALVEYVRKEYELEKSVDLQLIKEQAINDICYRKLTFEGKSSVKAWQLIMYLSPDERFLTSELFDTTTDPREEERRKREALMAGLGQNKGASKGSDHAQVTIVEFSDFQCPYCRKLADFMEQVLATERNQVRLVFHHMPLSTHSWARMAAEGAACAQLQSNDAFWIIHNDIFNNQQLITPDNIKQKLIGFAEATKGLDMAAFRSCLENEMSLGLVFRDLNLASENSVDATPTLFINGHRLSGIKDADQLRRLIDEAAREPQ